MRELSWQERMWLELRIEAVNSIHRDCFPFEKLILWCGRKLSAGCNQYHSHSYGLGRFKAPLNPLLGPTPSHSPQSTHTLSFFVQTVSQIRRQTLTCDVNHIYHNRTAGRTGSACEPAEWTVWFTQKPKCIINSVQPM